MRKVNEDRRTRKTKTAIEKAFLELMVKRDINKITIKDITDLADTNRSTFYTHYEDIYDLLNSIENRILEEIAAETKPKLIETLADGNKIDLTRLLEYIKKQKAVLFVLLHSNRSAKFMNKLTMLMENMFFGNTKPDILPYKSETYKNLLTCFMVNGITSVLSYYMNYTKDISPQEMNSFINDILLTSIQGLDLKNLDKTM